MRGEFLFSTKIEIPLVSLLCIKYIKSLNIVYDTERKARLMVYQIRINLNLCGQIK